MTSIEVDYFIYAQSVRRNWDSYKRWLIENDFEEPERTNKPVRWLVENDLDKPERANQPNFMIVLTFRTETQAMMFKLRWL